MFHMMLKGTVDLEDTEQYCYDDPGAAIQTFNEDFVAAGEYGGKRSPDGLLGGDSIRLFVQTKGDGILIGKFCWTSDL